MEHASFTHNQKPLVLASTQGHRDLTGVSRQMRRLSGIVGGRNCKDAFVVIDEYAASPSNHEGYPSSTVPKSDGSDPPISPDQGGVLLAHRKANKTLLAVSPLRGGQWNPVDPTTGER